MATTSSSVIDNFHPYCSDTVKTKLSEATGLDPRGALTHLLREEPTIKAISELTQINRTQIYQAMAHFGIERPDYDHGEYMRQWYDEQPPDTGQRLTKKAHDAVRGSKRSTEQKRKIALANQENPKISKGERRVISLLDKNEIDCVPQLAVDVFNIDIAISEIMLAIEVNGGNWHTAPRKQRQDKNKRKYLETAGWQVVYLWGNVNQIEREAQALIKKIKQHEYGLLS